MASNTEWLARKLLELEQQVRALGRGTRLGHSSLQGESILALDEDGEVLAELGTGGVLHLDGPVPPRPTAPVLEQGVGTIFVRWDGEWHPLDDEDEQPTTPLDFDRIEVHATTDPEATEWDEDTLVGSITQRTGGVVMIRGWDLDDVVYVRLVCRSLADKVGEPSEPAEVTVTGIDVAAIVDELDAANVELSNLDGTMFAVGAELDALAITFKNLDTSVINTDDGTLAEALDDARQALEDARAEAKDYTDGTASGLSDEIATSIQDARAEIEAELDTVRTTADGKNRTYYQSTMPSASSTPAPVLGDLWFNTANGYRLHRHNGSTFIEVADGRISDLESEVENIDISGPLSEARDEWLADAAADAQAKAKAASDAAEAAAKLYADAVATGAVEGELEGIQDYADNAAEAARQAAIDAAIAEARVIANTARDEALAAALDADAVISQSVAQFENDLNVVRESADGKSKITWSTSAASGAGKAGDTWFRMSGNNIIGHWRHSGSAWVSMSLDATVIPNLDAGKINSGTIDAERIGAGSITADKLVVGGSTNVVPDPTFSNPEVSARRVANSTGYGGEWSIADGIVTLDPKAGLTSNPNLNLSHGSDRYAWTPEPGVQVVAKFQARVRSGEAQVRGTVYVRKRDGSTRYVSMVPGWSTLAQDWTELTFTYGIAPDDVGYTFAFQVLGSGTTGIVDFRLPFVAPLVGSTLIEDGTVTADKIRAGAVGATAIAAESIDASKIVAGGIQADSLLVPGSVGTTQIKDGAITTSKIEVGAITAQSGIIASLDAGVIKSGTVDSARIAAGSITADKILVGGAGNLLTNPGFTGDGAGWNIATYNPQIATSGGPTGEPVLSVQGPSNGGLFPYLGGLVQSAAGSFAPDLAVVEAGKRYWASVWVRADVDIPVGNAGMGFRLRELGSATLGWASPGTATNREVIPANTWAKVEGEFEVPTTTGTWNRLAFGLRANGALNGRRVEFSAPVLLPMVGATLIEDDAITTGKISANAIGARAIAADAVEAGKIAADSISGREIIANTIKAEHIAAFTITAGELAANSVSTDKLVANSVIADKIASNAITADKIKALAVTADKIAANAVTAGKIAANAITAGKIDSDAINGMVITGATVRTAAEGTRVEMNPSGIHAWDPDGVETFKLAQATGQIEAIGKFYSGKPGQQRVLIDDSLFNSESVIIDDNGNPVAAGGAGILFGFEGQASRSATIGYVSRPSGLFEDNQLVLRSPRGLNGESSLSLGLGAAELSSNNGLGKLSRVRLTSDGVWQYSASTVLGRSVHTGGETNWSHQFSTGGAPLGAIGSPPELPSDTFGVVAQEGYKLGLVGDTNIDLRAGGSSVEMQNSRIDTHATTSIVFTTDSGGYLAVSGDSSGGFMRSTSVYNRTYSSGANVYVTSSGNMGRSTSARRYKADEQEIAPAEYAEGLLSIPFKSWLDKGQLERQAELKKFREDNPYCPTPEHLAEAEDEVRRSVGAVSEDFIDAGLDQFATFDQYGRPDGLQYDRIGVALIPIIKGMKEQIARLEAANGITESEDNHGRINRSAGARRVR